MPKGINEAGPINRTRSAPVLNTQPTAPGGNAGNLRGRSVELQRASSARAPSPEAGPSRAIATVNAQPAGAAPRWRGGQPANNHAAPRVAEAALIHNPAVERQRRTEALTADLQSLKGLSKDLQRWKAPLPASVAKKLQQVEEHLNGGRIDEGRALLRSIDTGIRALHAPLRHKRDYKASVARIRNEYDRLAAFAASNVKQHPELKTKLAAYEAANKAARYDGKISSADQEVALTTLASTGAQLVDELTKAVDTRGNHQGASTADARLQSELQQLLHSSYADTLERAERVKPSNRAQLELSRRLPHEGLVPKSAGFVLGKVRIAKALLSPPDDEVAPAPSEARYCRRLQAAETRLKAVQRYVRLSDDSFSSVTLTQDQRRIARNLDTTLQRLPAWDAEHPLDSPARYDDALTELAHADVLADELIATWSVSFARAIDDLDGIAEPAEKAAAALDIFRDHSLGDEKLVVMRTLPTEQRLKLLGALRGGKAATALSHEVQVAQSKIYKSMSLDGNFRQLEKEVRNDVVATLTRDHKHLMRRAQAEWPTWSDQQKLEVLTLVTNTYGNRAGFTPVPIAFDKLAPGVGGMFQPFRERIVINSTRTGMADFETMMNTIFHENSHNWQYQMMDSMQRNPASIPIDDPRHQQTQLFAVNRDFYDEQPEDKKGSAWTNPSLAYREQPLEAHAFLAGSKFARDLMRALNA